MGIDNRVIGAAITELRMRAGMTQQQLAAGLNVSHQAVSKWEKGGVISVSKDGLKENRLNIT